MKDLRILVIDDDGAIHKLLRELFRLWGCKEVRVASDGKEGLEAFRQFGPDVVLMDMEMPAMDGYESSRAINDLDGSVPVILLTGVPYNKRAKKAVEQGYARYIIPKPFNTEQLKMAIMEATKGTSKRISKRQGAVA